MPAIFRALQKQFELNTKRIESESSSDCPDPDAKTPWKSHAHALSRESFNAISKQQQQQRRSAGQTIKSSTVCHRGFVKRRIEQLNYSASPLAHEMVLPQATTKGWSTSSLVALGRHMKHVPRVSAVKEYEKLYDIIKEYEADGVPLIIEDWEKTPYWPGDELFGVNWLLEHSDEMIAVRDCVTRKDREIPFKEFIEKSRTISNYSEENEAERLYGKDAICPKEWRDWLMESAIPEVLKPGGTEDVLELLPDVERVETLMCYYGIGDTFTAAHKDLCASSGHNLMCSAERGGSAFWFMTRSSDAARAASYFQKLGAELDHETHVATPEEFAEAPFAVYVAEQRVGDLVLVPRRSCHQVVNHGGITAKMSWSRMTIEGLSIAFHHELPVYRRVCRSETYRVKLLVYRTLLEYIDDLEREQEDFKTIVPADTAASCKARSERAISRLSGVSTLTPSSSPEPPDSVSEVDAVPTLTPKHEKLVADVRTLLNIYDKILKEEHHGGTPCELRIRPSSINQQVSGDSTEPISTDPPSIPAPAGLYHDGLTCDFCGADIFASFFECRACSNPSSQEDNIIVCPSCYIEGRSCTCVIMTPVQQFPMDMLLEVQHRAQRLLNTEGYRENVVKVTALTHQTIDELVDHPGVFSAACQLLRVRTGREKQPTKTCRLWLENNHLVPADAALNCKKCHSARCYRHILEYGYHAADALKLFLSDNTRVKWHSHHVKRRKALAEQSPVVQKAEETGEPCDMGVSLVLHAGKYTSCRPVCNKLRPGWYDDVQFLDSMEPTVPQSKVNGFSGPVHNQSDDDAPLDEDVTSSSPDELSDHRPSARKPSGLKLRLNMKTASRPPLQAPKSKPQILLRKLSSKEREKYVSTHTLVARTTKGPLRGPPGIPANEIPLWQRRELKGVQEDVREDKQESQRAKEELKVIEGEFQRTLNEPQRVMEILQRMEEEMIQLREENARLQRMLTSQPGRSNNTHFAAANTRADVQLRGTPFDSPPRQQGRPRRAERPPVVLSSKDRRNVPAPRDTTSAPPLEPRLPRQDKPRNAAPVTSQNNAKMRKRRHSLVSGDDEVCSDASPQRKEMPINGQHEVAHASDSSIERPMRDTASHIAPPRAPRPRPVHVDRPLDESPVKSQLMHPRINASTADDAYKSVGKNPGKTANALCDPELEESDVEQEHEPDVSATAMRTYKDARRTIRNESKRRKYDDDSEGASLSTSPPRTPPPRRRESVVVK